MKAVAVAVGLLALGLAGSVGAGILEACGLGKLQAPQAEQAMLADAGFDMDAWVPVGLDPGEAQDTHVCSGQVRPGARLTIGCTMSWVFRDAQGDLYITTAGHCTSSVGQQMSANGVTGAFGTVVYRVNAGVGRDIALIKIHPSHYAVTTPTLCHWGGPQGVATGPTAPTGDAMQHYGWGVMWQGQQTRARAGHLPAANWFDDGVSAAWVGMNGFTDGGDSGSPMMLGTQLAAGVHTHRLNVPTYGFGPKAATRLDVWIPRIESALGIDLEIEKGLPVDPTVP